MATEKEATVYIVDMGASMGERRNGRNEPDLDYAMRYVWDKLTSTVRLLVAHVDDGNADAHRLPQPERRS